ncbi:CcdB-like protein [Escherichia coli]
MLGGADNPNGELPSYITGADSTGVCRYIVQTYLPHSGGE